MPNKTQKALRRIVEMLLEHRVELLIVYAGVIACTWLGPVALIMAKFHMCPIFIAVDILKCSVISCVGLGCVKKLRFS